MAKVNSIGNTTSELEINGAYSLPTIDGGVGNALATDGNGNVSWVSQASGGLTYEEVTDATKIMQSNYAYGANNSTSVQFTLPTTAPKDSIIQIIGLSGVWEIGQNDNQSILFGTNTTSIGTRGHFTSENLGDCVTLCCVEANTKWRVISYWGSFNKYTINDFSALEIFLGQSFVIARKSNSALWSWGRNSNGSLGDGTLTNRSSPVAVVGGHQFSSVALGRYFADYTIARKSDAKLWSWGRNTYGNIGDGTTTNRVSPVAVIGNHIFNLMEAGYFHSIAIKYDSRLWSWGDNTYGQLGDGTRTSRSSPVAVIGGHLFVSAKAGLYYTMARKSNSTLWSWGYNTYGQLGDGTTTHRSSPVAVIGGHLFISVETQQQHTIARKSNGTLWSWGNNTYGQLGVGNTTNRSSPVAVIGGHSFTSVAVGLNHTIALKADGSAWAWGYNNSGQLGDGTITNRSSPVAVIGNHSFTSVVTRNLCTLARKANGSIWAWGYNLYGELGLGDTINRSSPVIITEITY